MDAQQPTVTNMGRVPEAVQAGEQAAVSDYFAAPAGAVRPKKDKLPSRKALKRKLEEIVNKKEKYKRRLISAEKELAEAQLEIDNLRDARELCYTCEVDARHYGEGTRALLAMWPRHFTVTDILKALDGFLSDDEEDSHESEEL